MADHIVVLHEGRVLEEGSHEQLMVADRQYAHLFNPPGPRLPLTGGQQPAAGPGDRT